ncbi:MAG: DUF58 domain-containing protein [Chloroflexota bacterium]
MKTSFKLILGLIFGIFLLGIITLKSSEVVLAIPLAAYLFAAILRRPEALNLSITREIYPEFAPQGAPLTVKVTVLNKGSLIDELVVEDVLPNGITKIDGKSSTITVLEAHGTVELTYTIEAQRGEYKGYGVLVHASDFLSFFELSFVYRTAPHLVIHPHYPKLDRIKIRPPQTRGFAGPIPARQGGTGVDFWGVREYQTGDSQRQINWRLAARSSQDLYVNIFEQERVADIGLIVDARLRANIVTGSDSLFEHSVHAAAALAENFLDDGNRVSLLIYGSGMSRVLSGYGKMQRDRILRELSKATLSINYALGSLEHLPTRLFPAKSQIVLISSLLPEDIPVIINMRAHGYAVIVISPDPIAYEYALAQDISGTAYRIARAERSFILSQLRQSGVQTVDWPVDQPFELIVRETLTRLPLVSHDQRGQMR